MKKVFLKSIVLCSLILSTATFTSCKKEKPVPPVTETEVETIDNTTTSTVEIAPDAELTNNLTDATKDFPGVVATVNSGEIILTGEITRDELPALMRAMHALHPKKVTNNLNIK